MHGVECFISMDHLYNRLGEQGLSNTLLRLLGMLLDSVVDLAFSEERQPIEKVFNLVVLHVEQILIQLIGRCLFLIQPQRTSTC